MKSLNEFILLSNPNISSHSFNRLHLRSLLSFSSFRKPTAVNTSFYRTTLNGAGTLKNTQKGVCGKKKDSFPLQLSTCDLDEDEKDQEEGRIETLVREIKNNFLSLRGGEISPSAYDTAWIARIPSIDDPNKLQFPTTMEWIIMNQLEDGSWGDSCYFLLYDRLVCTLSCVITLARWRQGYGLIAKGLCFLQTHIRDLDKEESMLRRTAGFEMIFPSMLNEAKSLGLNLPYDLPCIKRIIMLREEKKQRIPMEVMNSTPTSLLFSLEGIQELVQWDKILNLQSANGSIWDSPSATAATYLKTKDSKCLEYLTYIMQRFEDHAPSFYPIDTFECSWMIDTIQRLGIDHHFRKEISYILDFLYRNLRKDGLATGSDAILTDIDDTCMGLRLLRLHGYPISPDVLEYFKDDEGSFVCMMGETHKGISDFFNLYRFSQIAFPGEKTLKQAKIFTEEHLINNIKNNQVYDKWAIKKALHMEIEFALKNPWKMSLPRLEVQEYISNYGENDVWIGNALYRLYNINNPKNLELAKLEHNKLHAMHTSEANSILLWWNSFGFDDHLVTQLNPKEIHLSISVAIYEPEFSASRIAYTKWNCIENILMNMFQSHESIEELKVFCHAINEWHPALVQVLPTKLKQVFIGAYNSMNELANEAMNAQGKNFFPYLHDLIKRQVQQHLNIREIKDSNKFQNFEEYVDQIMRSLGVAIRLIPAMFLMGNVLSDNALKELDQRSKIHQQLVSYIALLNLVTEQERAAVYLYMKEQKCSEQDALAHLEEKIDEVFAELTHEYLKPNQHIPHSCRRMLFEHGRIIRFYLNKISNDHIVDGMEKVYTIV